MFFNVKDEIFGLHSHVTAYIPKSINSSRKPSGTQCHLLPPFLHFGMLAGNYFLQLWKYQNKYLLLMIDWQDMEILVSLRWQNNLFSNFSLRDPPFLQFFHQAEVSG